MYFILKLLLVVIKTARISVHIRRLFIGVECLLIGCVSYVIILSK